MQSTPANKSQTEEWNAFTFHRDLGITSLHAFHHQYAYPRHSHDHFVICLIAQGIQSFTHKGTKYITPPQGAILINPSIVHTGEPATERGFKLCSIYPTEQHLAQVATGLSGRHCVAPYFRDVRVDRVDTTKILLALHHALVNNASKLERESRLTATLSHLIQHYAEIHPQVQSVGNEHYAVQQIRDFIETNFAAQITLNDLSRLVALSPFYLLRVFKAEVGLPPHAYLTDVRIRRSKQLIEVGIPLVDVAHAVGFSHQSHLTRRFRQIVGVTPGKYAIQVAPQSGGIGR